MRAKVVDQREDAFGHGIDGDAALQAEHIGLAGGEHEDADDRQDDDGQNEGCLIHLHDLLKTVSQQGKGVMRRLLLRRDPRTQAFFPRAWFRG